MNVFLDKGVSPVYNVIIAGTPTKSSFLESLLISSRKPQLERKKKMPKTRKGSSIELYNSRFATTLRDLMEQHGTTQKELADAVGVRPQTLSLYTTGETQPNVDKLLKIAEYFDVTTDYLITGTVIEDIPVREMLGLSERTVENMKLIKDGYFEDAPYMLPLLDRLLGDKDFYLALQQAATWYGRKRQLAAAAADDADSITEDEREFCDWKAVKYMETYLLDFMQADMNIQ